MDWSKIKAEYISGGISYRNLAQKHGVSFNTLKDMAVREKWTELRTQAHNKATTKMVDVVSTQNAKIDDKYYKLVDMLFDKAEEVMVNTSIWQVSNLKECKGVKSDADMREQEARIEKLRKEIEGEQKDTNITITFGDEVKKYGV